MPYNIYVILKRGIVMKKRIVSLTLFIVILCFGAASLANAAVIYENVCETVLTKGVTQQTIHRFTTGGWYKINIVSADLSETYLSLKTLTSNKGINVRENVLELAKQSNAVAAINADFFQISGLMPLRSSALGVVVDNGEMLTTPARGKNMAVAAVDFNNVASMGIWDQYITLRAPNGEEKQIYHINKYYDDGALVLFNNYWDEISPGAPVAPIEMVVEDDIVTDIRVWQDGVAFSENSFVIASTTADDEFLTDNFEVGDKVEISMWLEPNPDNYKMAVGGGTMLLLNGMDAPVTHNISGTHPRTAMGVDKSGTKVFLVTVDGRQKSSVGMSLGELRNLMRDIGCYNAINLDGGGSTTFVSNEPRQGELKLINTVSDGSMRKVANGVGIMSSAPLGEAAILDIFVNERGIYAKTPQAISVNIYDKYYHNLDFSIDDVKFSISGAEGYFVNNVLYPLQSGHVTITAEYKRLTASVDKYIREPVEKSETDSMKQPDDAVLNGTKIAVLGDTNYKNILGLLYSYRAMAKVNEQADAIVLAGKTAGGVVDRAAAPVIYGDYYYAAYKQNNLIIQMINSKGGLLKSDPEQWNRFLSQLDVTKVKNVIITLTNPIDSFEDSFEKDLFKQMLNEKLIDKGKNVFVIYDDTENTVKIEEGIRYFGLKGIKDVKSTNFTSLKECCYLLITSDGNDVWYQIKGIL